jgi:hypothetical protein
MTKGHLYIAMLAALLAGAPAASRTEQPVPSGSTSSSPNPAPGASIAQLSVTTGTVLETMDSGGYTYVRVDTGQEQLWAAAPQVAVKVADTVRLPEGAPMTGYHSATLNRSFELIYFVAYIAVEGGGNGGGEWTKDPAQQPQEQPPVKIDLSGIDRAEGGKTVAEIFDEKTQLSGQAVVVRGKAVKVTRNVMGKTWIHLKDGTAGVDGADDLVVTTTADAEVGNTILASGIVTLDLDIGFGYEFDVLLQEATVTVE